MTHCKNTPASLECIRLASLIVLQAIVIEAMQQLVWSARLENQMKDFGEQSTIIRERFLSDILCNLSKHINHAGVKKNLNNPFLNINCEFHVCELLVLFVAYEAISYKCQKQLDDLSILFLELVCCFQVVQEARHGTKTICGKLPAFPT